MNPTRTSSLDRSLIIRLASPLIAAAMILAACTPQATPTAAPTAEQTGPVELAVMTHDSFAVSEEVIAQFERANNAKVTFIKSGDTGTALNRAILTKESPQADVFYGVDNTFLSRALTENIYEAYQSPLLADVPDEFEVDKTFHALPVDYGDVCLNYDTAYFAERGLAVPASLEDLAKPEYAGLLAVENPATSSPGLAFLLATVAHFGVDDYIDYWQSLVDNDVVVTTDWSTAYYTNFSGSSGKGPQPLVVSYASSPAAEMIYADPRPETPPTASVLAPSTCFRQIEFAGILRGTTKRAVAEKFIDFLLSAPFQEDVPLQMFVYPVNQNAQLPADFEQYAQVAEQPAVVDPALIDANRDAWLQAWTETVLR